MPAAATFAQTESFRKNIIKLEPFNFFSGQVPIVYERHIVERLSAEVFGGITHRNYYRQIWDDFRDYPVGTPRLGYTFGAATKYYLEEEPNMGMFIGLEYRYKHFNLLRQDSISTDLIPEIRKTSDIKLTGGYSIIFDNGLAFDFYFGMGLRILRLSESYFFAKSGPIAISGTSNIFANQFVFTVGFRLGYAF